MAAIRVIVRLFGAQGPRTRSDPISIFSNHGEKQNKSQAWGLEQACTLRINHVVHVAFMKGSELFRGELWEYMYSMGTALHQN